MLDKRTSDAVSDRIRLSGDSAAFDQHGDGKFLLGFFQRQQRVIGQFLDWKKLICRFTVYCDRMFCGRRDTDARVRGFSSADCFYVFGAHKYQVSGVRLQVIEKKSILIFYFEALQHNRAELVVRKHSPNGVMQHFFYTATFCPCIQ